VVAAVSLDPGHDRPTNALLPGWQERAGRAEGSRIPGPLTAQRAADWVQSRAVVCTRLAGVPERCVGNTLRDARLSIPTGTPVNRGHGECPATTRRYRARRGPSSTRWTSSTTTCRGAVALETVPRKSTHDPAGHMPSASTSWPPAVDGDGKVAPGGALQRQHEPTCSTGGDGSVSTPSGLVSPPSPRRSSRQDARQARRATPGTKGGPTDG
jgi:hypothetical protein